MKIGSGLAAAIVAAVLSGVAFGQVKSSGSANVPACANVQRSGQRIVSNLGMVEFSVPAFSHVTKAADVDYVEYYVRYGPKQDKLWLKFMFGPIVGGQSPHDLADSSINWTARDWGCYGQAVGTDWRGVGTDGRRWRHIAITLGGFATYEAVPPKAADYFDKILDSMCCGKCFYCTK